MPNLIHARRIVIPQAASVAAGPTSWGVPKIGTGVTAASGDITLIEPVGVAQNDLMVACIAYRDSAAYTLPALWTVVATQQSSGDTTSGLGTSIASAVMAYIVRGGSAPDLTFTRTGGDVARGVILSYSGVNTSSTYDTGSANTLGAGATTATTGTITTAEDNELLILFGASARTTGASAFDAATDPATASGATDTTTAPTAGTWIERFDSPVSTGADVTCAVADAIRATAGATGQLQCTFANCRNVLTVGAFKKAA
jgi:hypothetical protein